VAGRSVFASSAQAVALVQKQGIAIPRAARAEDFFMKSRRVDSAGFIGNSPNGRRSWWATRQGRPGGIDVNL
jgi:hypothetical protein